MRDKASTSITLYVDHGPHLAKSQQAILVVDGKGSAVVDRALEFCQQFNAAMRQIESMGELIASANLLLGQDGTLQNDEAPSINIKGRQIIDTSRLDTTTDAELVEWHRRGVVATGILQQVSMQAWTDLGRRQKLRDAA